MRAAGAGHDAELDLGLAELRVVPGDDDVAGHRQLAAAAQGEAAHRGDDRLADAPDPVPVGERVLAGQVGRVLDGELLDVGAGREGALPVAGEHDDPAVGVAVEGLERVGDLADDLEAQAR